MFFQKKISRYFLSSSKENGCSAYLSNYISILVSELLQFPLLKLGGTKLYFCSLPPQTPVKTWGKDNKRGFFSCRFIEEDKHLHYICAKRSPLSNKMCLGCSNESWSIRDTVSAPVIKASGFSNTLIIRTVKNNNLNSLRIDKEWFLMYKEVIISYNRPSNFFSIQFLEISFTLKRMRRSTPCKLLTKPHFVCLKKIQEFNPKFARNYSGT